MSGNKGLLDSNVIIDASKGVVSIQDIVNKYDYLYSSIITYVETQGYNFEDEEEKEIISRILNSVEIVTIDKKIADTAIHYRKIKKIKLPDALILATAKHLKTDLLTSDISDFQNIDKSVNLIAPIKK